MPPLVLGLVMFLALIISYPISLLFTFPPFFLFFIKNVPTNPTIKTIIPITPLVIKPLGSFLFLELSFSLVLDFAFSNFSNLLRSWASFSALGGDLSFFRTSISAFSFWISVSIRW